jgi:quercetin dioxygenase-like cupin family protein
MTAESMTPEARTIVLAPGAGTPVVGAFAGVITFKARGAETGGTMLAIESRIPPGEGPPLHRHAGMDEAIYVLDGELRVRIGADVHPAPAGAFVFIPRGIAHAWQAVGAVPARFFAIVTPAGLEHFFERMAADDRPADPAAIAALASAVGMEIIGPPLAQADASSRSV